LVKAGGATAIRSKGEIKRLYRATKDRNFATSHQAAGQIHAASKTTTRVRNDDHLVIAPPWILAHK
jgi:hypothetical protein